MFLDFNLKEMETFDIMSHSHEGMNEAHSIISTGECLLLHSIQYTENHVYKRTCCNNSKTSIKEANTYQIGCVNLQKWRINII